jgi:hypothetical protein
LKSGRFHRPCITPTPSHNNSYQHPKSKTIWAIHGFLSLIGGKNGGTTADNPATHLREKQANKTGTLFCN